MGKPYDSRTYRRNRKQLLSTHPPCALCGEPGADTADHIIPVSRGGSPALTNLRAAHRECNSLRGNRMTTKYQAKW